MATTFDSRQLCMDVAKEIGQNVTKIVEEKNLCDTLITKNSPITEFSEENVRKLVISFRRFRKRSLW